MWEIFLSPIVKMTTYYNIMGRDKLGRFCHLGKLCKPYRNMYFIFEKFNLEPSTPIVVTQNYRYPNGRQSPFKNIFRGSALEFAYFFEKKSREYKKDNARKYYWSNKKKEKEAKK
jgi:hypothetical protein